LLVLPALVACEGERKKEEPEAKWVAPPPILIDGSSTVFPVTRSVVSLYAENVTAEIKVNVSGTGGGFKKFCNREIAIAGASRPISEAEAKLCHDAKVEFIELPVAFDGIAVVVNKDNDWAKDATVEELKKLWEPAAEGKVQNWSDVRASWPKKPIELFGPGRDSGTFDYFTETVVGKVDASRKDYRSAEDDEELVKGVSGNASALGYFGFSYYVKNADRLRALAVDDGHPDNGEGAIEPTPSSISDGTYQPLARPLFIYVSVEAAKRKEVDDLVRFYLRAARMVAGDVGCIPLPPRLFELARQRFVNLRTGSAFQGVRSTIGITMEDLLEAETAQIAEVSARTEASK
jgi:phosphate transport system substrate-binding protein